MGAESFIKGRIAEALIEELLRTCGNKVYRFGYESILQNLIQTEATFDRHTRNGEQIRSIPDFFVLNAHGKLFFTKAPTPIFAHHSERSRVISLNCIG